MALIPDADAGAAGVGGSPTVKFKIGGKNFAISVSERRERLERLAHIRTDECGIDIDPR